MNEEPSVDYHALRRTVDLAFLATSEKFTRALWREGVKVFTQERMSDQTRRTGLLISAMSLGEGADGWWVPEQRMIAAALGMDEGDLCLAIEKLCGWGLLAVEPRDEGLWYQLLPSRLTLGERALKAAAAFARLKTRRANPGQLVLLPRARSERIDGGFGEALAEADREGACGPAATGGRAAADRARGAEKPVGRFPTGGPPVEVSSWEIPNRELGDSQLLVGRFPTGGPPVGRFPTGGVTKVRAGARTESLIELHTQPQRTESNESGGSGRWVAGGGSGKPIAAQFRDEDKNRLMTQVDLWMEREAAGRCPAEAEQSRRTWLSRIAKADPPTLLALMDGREVVAEEIKKGKTITAPLGRWFVIARGFARAAGRSLRMLCHL